MKFLLLILLIISTPLFAEGESNNGSPVIANFDTEPSGMVNGSVDVISGGWNIHQIDLILPGPLPLIVERAHNTIGGNILSSCVPGWNFNFEQRIYSNTQNNLYYLYWQFGFSSVIPMECVVHKKKSVGTKGKTHLLSLLDSATNTSSGIISAKTNLRNFTLKKYNDDSDYYCWMNDGSGCRFSTYSTKQLSYYIKERVKQDLNRFHYKWVKTNRDGKRLIKNLKSCNPKGELYSEITFEFPEDKNSTKLIASDGKTVTYTFGHQYKNKDGEKIRRLSKVESSFAPPEGYSYEDNSHRISRKDLGNDRFQEITYYINDLSKDDPIKGRVKELKAPVGHDNTPITTHTFKYNIFKKKDKLEGGTTEVLDALDHKTLYHYDRHKRLTCIEKFDDSNQPYSNERIFWEGPYIDGITNLVSRTFEGADGKIHFCKLFIYDKKGNVLNKMLFGNFSGQNNSPIEMDYKYPLFNDCEYEEIIYKYGAKNLMTLEKIGDVETKYSYWKGTDRLRDKLFYSNGVFKAGQSHVYDENGTLIEEIFYHEDKQFQKAKYITPTKSYPFGLPEWVEEKYYNPQTGSFETAKKVKTYFSLEGRPLQEDVYDQSGTLVYSQIKQYDAIGRCTFEKHKNGDEIKKEWDIHGNLLSIEGPMKGFKKEFFYDYSNRLIKEVIHLGNGDQLTTSHQYDYLGNRICTIDWYGNQTHFEYDAFKRLTKTTFADQSTRLAQYDVMSNPIVTIDGNGEATISEFNIRGKPTKINYADGSTETYVYNIDGTVKEHIDRKGLLTCFEYDWKKRIVKKSSSNLEGESFGEHSFVYNPSQLLSETDPMGITTEYRYDHFGRMIEKLKGNQRTTYEYDSLGRVNCIKEYYSESDYAATFQLYDVLDRVIEKRVEDCLGNVFENESYLYDANGNKIQTTKKTSTGISVIIDEYDPLNRLIKKVDPEGNATYIRYLTDYINDEGENVPCTETVDPKGVVTLTVYNTVNRVDLVLKKNIFGRVVQRQEFSYDPNGNKIKSVDTVISANAPERIVTTLWSYLPCNKLSECVEGAGTDEPKTTRQTYNRYGQLESVIKPDGVVVNYDYDAMGKVCNLYSSDGSIHYLYTYDLLGRLIQAEDCNASTCTTRTYDQEGNLIKEVLGSGITVQYTYDRMGRPLSTKTSNVEEVFYRYDAKHLKRVEWKGRYHDYQMIDSSGIPLKESNPLGEISTRLNKNGEVIEVIAPNWKETDIQYDKDRSLLSRVIKDESEKTCRYAYDDLGQLTQEEGIFSASYQYDSLNNRIEKDGIAQAINDLNQITDDGVFVYTYDRNGNRIKRENSQTSSTYRYDALDRLIEMQSGDLTVYYTYDEQNRRLSKKVCQGGMEKTFYFLYQGHNEVGMVDSIGKLLEYRVLGVGKGAEIGASLFFELQGEIYYPVHDHGGNIMLIYDETGLVKERYHYSSFGESITDEDKLNPWRFSSKRFDSESGLINFGRRYYDPKCGRWLTPDPLGFQGGPNLYAYVMNSPLTHFDLYGLFTISFGFEFPQPFPTMSQVLTAPGKFIKFVGDHCIPVPFVRDVFSLVGTALGGAELKGFKRHDRDEHSSNTESSNHAFAISYITVSFTNGILNRKNEVSETANLISEYFGKVHIGVTHNASHGFMSDLFECLAGILGIPTHSVKMKVQEIRDRIQDVGGVDSGNEIWQMAHSQGGLILHRALQQLTPEERKMINVVTFGSAKIIPNEGLKSCVNYVSTRDSVPFVADPIGLARAWFSGDGSLKFLQSKGAYFVDHAIMGDTYRKAIKGLGDSFKKDHGWAN